MWFRFIVCSGVLTSTCAVPPGLQLLVDLFNELVGLTVSFDHDFGSGVPLLNGEAKVYMYSSVELLASSEQSREKGLSTMMLKCPLGFRIVPKRAQETIDLNNCYMKVQYSINVNATKPSSFWVDSCDLTFSGGKFPQSADQFLPLLSQALLIAANKHLSFEGVPQSVGMSEVQQVLGRLLLHDLM